MLWVCLVTTKDSCITYLLNTWHALWVQWHDIRRDYMTWVVSTWRVLWAMRYVVSTCHMLSVHATCCEYMPQLHDICCEHIRYVVSIRQICHVDVSCTHIRYAVSIRHRLWVHDTCTWHICTWHYIATCHMILHSYLPYFVSTWDASYHILFERSRSCEYTRSCEWHQLYQKGSCKYSLLHSLCHFFCLKTQSILQSFTSLLPCCVEKRPLTLRLENTTEWHTTWMTHHMNDTPHAVGCTARSREDETRNNHQNAKQNRNRNPAWETNVLGHSSFGNSKSDLGQ